MRNCIKLFLIILLPLMMTDLFAQGILDARRLALAGSNTAITEGTEFVGLNPATLGKRRDFSFELHMLSGRLMIKNNSFSLNEYDRYFTTGDSLTSQDIDDLFGQIPDAGLRMDAALGLKTFSLYAYPFSLTLYGLGSGYVNLPKAPFELPFYGNVEKKEFRLDDFDAEFWGAGAVSFAVGVPVTQYFGDRFDFVSVGLAATSYFGLQYANVTSATGRLLTEDTYILADGRVEMRTSEGGSGFGLDFGLLAEYQEKWTFSLSFSNLVGSINWKNNDSLRVFAFQADTIQTNNLDSLQTTDTDTAFGLGNFRTGLPRTLHLSAAYQFRPNLIFTASWRQGLNSSLGNTTTPLISAGAEYKPIPFIPLRGGIGIGGENSFVLGLGLGIDLKYWQLNFGYLNHNFRWFRGARSVDLALSTQFRF